ncbi:HD domain-containing protein [Legionella septentrionalis]|uniref:HD domain-containing protein n=1 Tax=Legionella septentrionalis TaxID=2498109 RepID=UPI000F8E33D8|nr:HD domain-containing protein [Legionella septentrionalis]RUR08480.1 HD domain-containing protein [Legionella septentrionalis]
MSSSHIINDPIHGVMLFSEEEKDIIKHYMDKPYFQRLRRIKQLGCGDLIFPGAVHTRFSHSLGACYLAKKVCEKLEITAEKQEIMIAALLHDIGHGPFSHAFEKMYKNLSEKNKEYRISHDNDWTPKFIKSFEEANKGLNEIVSSFFEEEEGVSSHQYKPIISSQLDVDRLDYLLRDSHFCGVPYGNIDLKWIISCMEFIDGKFLGIDKKGIGAIEHYIFARRLMTKNVYYNKKKNAAEYLVREFLLSLEEHLSDKAISKTSLGLFLKEYFSYVKKIESSNEAGVKAESKNNFIENAFAHYSNITDDDIWICLKQVCKEKTKAGELAEKLVSRNLPNCYELNPSRITKAENILAPHKPKEKNEWKLSIDKLNFEAYRSQNSQIYIKEHLGASDIFHESTILNQLSDKKETTCLLYIDKSIPKDEQKKILISLNKAHCLRMPYENHDETI